MHPCTPAAPVSLGQESHCGLLTPAVGVSTMERCRLEFGFMTLVASETQCGQVGVGNMSSQHWGRQPREIGYYVIPAVRKSKVGRYGVAISPLWHLDPRDGQSEHGCIRVCSMGRCRCCITLDVWGSQIGQVQIRCAAARVLVSPERAGVGWLYSPDCIVVLGRENGSITPAASGSQELGGGGWLRQPCCMHIQPLSSPCPQSGRHMTPAVLGPSERKNDLVPVVSGSLEWGTGCWAPALLYQGPSGQFTRAVVGGIALGISFFYGK